MSLYVEDEYTRVVRVRSRAMCMRRSKGRRCLFLPISDGALRPSSLRERVHV